MALKNTSYLTLAETKAWLRITDNSLDSIIERLINTACERVEKYIDSPVLTREFIEFHDGNNSNVIIPSQYPVTEIVEIKIDFNRDFDSATAVRAENYVLRGLPSMKIQGEDPEILIQGSDIVLRDDSNVAILGRIFSGSVIQSIKLTYKAGRGETADELPSDLVQATLMLVEHLYMLRENRELNVKSKSNMGGQGYTREPGMPKEIAEMLDVYKDMALPPVSQPQRNTFKI